MDGGEWTDLASAKGEEEEVEYGCGVADDSGVMWVFGIFRRACEYLPLGAVSQ
jgi:hypothetical protein